MSGRESGDRGEHRAVLSGGLKRIEQTVRFDAADDYERFMGAWSRAIGEKFLAWFGAPRGARWLDWPATLRRLRAAAPGDGQQWCAALPSCPLTDEHAILTHRQETLFPLQARARHHGGAA